ncbi:MAG: tripartite tricarboxylate transporter substrate binding protein [Betaproteobacteria bacterium]
MTTIAVLVFLLFGAVPALAQFPDHTVRLVVGFPVGSSPDLIARMLGEELAKGWKQPVVIDNRPGAGAILGSDSVAKAPADGYTVYIATLGALALNPHLYKKLPYDPVKDFAGITFLAENPFALAVNPGVPVKSVPELIAHAKANPGKLNFGAGASFAQLLGAAFNRRAGTDIVNVSYRGVQQAVTDFLAGQVQLLFADLPAILPQHKAGKARIVAITGSRRSPIAGEIPTLQELGLAGMDLPTWYAAVAPSGTPQPVLAKLNADIARVLAMPEVKKKLEAIGLDPRPSTPAYVDDLTKAEIAKWGVLVKEAGLQPE